MRWRRERERKGRAWTEAGAGTYLQFAEHNTSRLDHRRVAVPSMMCHERCEGLVRQAAQVRLGAVRTEHGEGMEGRMERIRTQNEEKNRSCLRRQSTTPRCLSRTNRSAVLKRAPTMFSKAPESPYVSTVSSSSGSSPSARDSAACASSSSAWRRATFQRGETATRG